MLNLNAHCHSATLHTPHIPPRFASIALVRCPFRPLHCTELFNKMSADVVAPLETAVSAEEIAKKIGTPADDVSVAMSIMSPFAKTSKKYAWPSIYDEIDEMLECCILTYPVADLRRMAREGTLSNSEVVSKLPISATKCVDAIASNLCAFKKSGASSKANASAASGDDKASTVAATAAQFCALPSGDGKIANADKAADESYAVRLDALKALHARQRAAKAEGKVFSVSSANYIAFSDDSTAKDELCYSVSVDRLRKRVTVCFRGASSDSAWATGEAWMKTMRNPAAKRPDQPQELKVHSKVYDCLFSPSSSGIKGPKGVLLNEYQAILQKSVLMALKRNPGYKLYVTGHSLGAAVATLFAFECSVAKDSIIPKPVTCVSIGGPYVGDANFRDAHQWLERQGKLRHIRVSNHQDLVTTMPAMSFKLNPMEAAKSSVGTPFKHVGVNIQLREDGGDDGKQPSYEVTYPKVTDSLLETCKDEIERGWRNSFLANLSSNPSDYWTWAWHGKCAYNDRIHKNKAALEKIKLDALYKDGAVVGDLVGQI